jgi:hypothetical protein
MEALTPAAVRRVDAKNEYYLYTKSNILPGRAFKIDGHT